MRTASSGISDDADEEAGERYEDLFLERPNYSVIETADYLPQFVGKPPNFAPGEGCRYCNVGYVLLGLMIERASGSTYRSYVAAHVFAPAGMERSGFWKEGVNVGASGMLRHYPRQDITLAVLAVGEQAVRAPIKAIDEAVRNAE